MSTRTLQTFADCFEKTALSPLHLAALGGVAGAGVGALGAPEHRGLGALAGGAVGALGVGGVGGIRKKLLARRAAMREAATLNAAAREVEKKVAERVAQHRADFLNYEIGAEGARRNKLFTEIENMRANQGFEQPVRGAPVLKVGDLYGRGPRVSEDINRALEREISPRFSAKSADPWVNLDSDIRQASEREARRLWRGY